MNLVDVENEILRRAYFSWLSSSEIPNLEHICSDLRFDENDVRKSAGFLQNRGEIIICAGNSYEITFEGIIAAENKNIIPSETIEKVNNDRLSILEFLNNSFETKGAEYGFEDITAIEISLDLSEELVIQTIRFLEQICAVEPITNQEFRITEYGRKYNRIHSNKKNVRKEFDDVAALTPTIRGREFQKVFARVMSLEGWNDSESVRTSNEEIDIIVYKKREYYLVECKWEKDKIEAAVVREFFGKLEPRSGVNGMLVSMSGFTSGVDEQIITYLHSKIIIPFGPKDIELLINKSTSFDDMLDHKYHNLIIHKRVLYS